jgi:hypothetical protein
MSVNIANARGGEFATSRKGGLDAYEVAFIAQKLEAGIPVSAIAKMLGRPVQTIRDGLPPKFREASRPERATAAPVQRQAVTADQVKWRPAPDRAKGIIREVCDAYCVTFGEITGDSRVRAVAHARHDAFNRLADAGFLLIDIGRFFRRDHTTVMVGIRAHEKRKASALDAKPTPKSTRHPQPSTAPNH